MSQAKSVTVRAIMTAGHSILGRWLPNDLPVAGVTTAMFCGRQPPRGGPGANWK
jgi:hypothetical protein